DSDLPGDNFVRVVREDPERRGLLYGGTEGGMFVSFDDGAHWQTMDLNLPPVPITDLTIRQGNLVAATQGRGFWVLDNLSVVRQSSADLARKAVHLFTPEPTTMMRTGGRRGDDEGANPPSGAVLSYYIADEQEGPLTIEIRDDEGGLVRSYSSEEGDFERCIVGGLDQRSSFEVKYPKHEEGLNQWAWDMRFTGLNCIEDIKLFAGFGGATVTPGTYRVTISVGGAESSADLVLLPDPRVEASPEDYEFLAARRREATVMLNDLLTSLAAARKARTQINGLMADYPEDDTLAAAGESAVARLTEWENKVTQTNYVTLEDEDSMPPMLDVHIRHVLDVIDRAGAPVSEGSLKRLTDLDYEWQDRKSELQAIRNTDLAAVNEWARTNGVLHVADPVE
ncbi:MAG: glycosyl hydrolase, partial [Gammaproteobacteria bacterium]|nr:glycosyl hydrolase [Gammaproteobacteria bacterium]